MKKIFQITTASFLTAIIFLTNIVYADVPMEQTYVQTDTNTTVVLVDPDHSGATYDNAGEDTSIEGSDGSDGGGSGGGSTYVPPDNADETAFLNAHQNIQLLIGALLGRCVSNGTGVAYGNLVGGDAYTFSTAEVTNAELLALMGSAQDMMAHTSAANSAIMNRYENFYNNFGGIGGFPALTLPPLNVVDMGNSNGYIGAAVDGDGNITGGGSGNPAAGGSGSPIINPTTPQNPYVYPFAPGTGSMLGLGMLPGGVFGINPYPMGDMAMFQNAGTMLGGYDTGMDVTQFLNDFYNSNGLLVGNGLGAQFGLGGLGPRLEHNIFLNPTINPNSLHPVLMTDYDMFGDRATGIQGIRSDLIPGGFNIADTWAGRFMNFGYANSGSGTYFGLLNEYHMTDMIINDRTNIQFIPNTRYWTLYDTDGVTPIQTVMTEEPYLIFHPTVPGTYIVGSSQQAVYTVRTTLKFQRNSYMFDTSTGNLLYFNSTELLPYSMGAVQQKKWIPTRGYIINVNDLGQIETIDDADNGGGIIKRVE